MIDEKKSHKKDPEDNLYYKLGKTINLNGINTFVIEAGKGESVVLVNGLAVTSYTWRGIIMYLKERFHVFAMDFKGTGNSEKPEGIYNVELYTEQLKELITYFKLKHVTLVGNSLGGGIVLRYAIKYPEDLRSLVLIDSVGYQKEKKVTSFLISLFRYKLFKMLVSKFLCKTAARLIIKWAVENEEIIDEQLINAYYKPLKEKGGIEALINLIRSLGYSDLNYEALSTINIPTLILWGQKDKWIPESDAYKLHEIIKTSQLVLLKNCGHAPQEEFPVRVSRLIENFIKM